MYKYIGDNVSEAESPEVWKQRVDNSLLPDPYEHFHKFRVSNNFWGVM